MIKGLVASLLIFSSVAFAETKTYPVSGMTCDSCVQSVKSKVCTLKDIEKCEVEIGKVTVTSKTTLNDEIITNAITSAGFTIAKHHEGHDKHEGMSCDHKDGKSCGDGGCGCKGEGKECTCDHSKGGCACKHHTGKHKGHGKHKKKK